MAKFKVTAPEPEYAGKVGKVQFHDGVATIDEDTHPAELAYCRQAGYLVEPVEDDEKKADDADEPKAEESEADEPKSDKPTAEAKPTARRATTKGTDK